MISCKLSLEGVEERLSSRLRLDLTTRNRLGIARRVFTLLVQLFDQTARSPSMRMSGWGSMPAAFAAFATAASSSR
jgi:hypothetical protein